MIPSLLVPAVLIGRWWLVPLAAVGWPVLLMANGVDTGGTRFLGDPVGRAGGTQAERRR